MGDMLRCHKCCTFHYRNDPCPDEEPKMATVACPRCGYEKSKPNSKTTVHCRKCGGTVPLIAEPESEYYGSDPLQNLLDKERGLNESGRVLSNRNQQLKGGL